MTAKMVGLLVAFGLLTACENAGGLGRSGDTPFAPTGVSRSAQSVDGLLVGHRLMAAGEYELALRAYLRAGAQHGLNADVLSALGSVNLQLGRLGQAEDLLRRATKKDEAFAASWNNLGVVLMEKGEIGEAARVFRIAFGLDSGESAHIRDNLRLALENLEDPTYDEEEDHNFALVRRGTGDYRLLSTP